jgi:hypothetical protein
MPEKPVLRKWRMYQTLVNLILNSAFKSTGFTSFKKIRRANFSVNGFFIKI